MHQALAQIDFLKKEAGNLQPAKPELEKVFWDKFRLEFNYNSNHIEGNTMTYGHTQLLLIFDKVGGDYTGREIEEMKNHDVAMKVIKEAAIDPEYILTEKFIKEINETILVRPFYKEAITPDGQPTRRKIIPGKYKEYPNSVKLENGEIFNYASPEETPAQMGDLMEWYHKESNSKELHPVQLAALFHYRFVRIHPFDDSNGRTSRLFMNYILMKNNYAPLVVESTDKRNYLSALNRADTGDIQAFVEYITGLALRWQELYAKALKGEKIEEEGDFDKEVELLKKQLSKNKEPRIKISEKVIRDLLSTSLLSLFKSIEEELNNKFNDLFWESCISLHATNFDQKVDNTSLIGNHIYALFPRLKDGGHLKIDFAHIGFKKDKTNIFNVYVSLTIQFQNYFYQIDIDNFNIATLKKMYDEHLTEEEIKDISKTMAKLELQEIKRRTK